MKTILTSLSILIFSFVNGQNLDNLHLTKVQSVDSIIFNLYNAISGDKGVERNWELMQYLFHKDAKLIPTGMSKDSVYRAHYITADEYIKSSGDFLIKNGFHEIEIHRVLERFGNICSVFSTYEAYFSLNDDKPFMRGINAIQLLFDGKRWWIMNITWSQESKSNPIPKQYLPN